MNNRERVRIYNAKLSVINTQKSMNTRKRQLTLSKGINYDNLFSKLNFYPEYIET